MTEQVLTKDEFIKFILEGSVPTPKKSSTAIDSALPEGFEDFDGFPEEEIQPPTKNINTSFAQRLLEALGFGYPDLYQAESLIRSNDTVVRNLLEKEQIAFWQKTPSRPYRTLLFESSLNNEKLLKSSPFKSSKVAHLDDVESALARMVIEVLEGFERGGESVTASVAKGKKEETLCVVSILDEREGDAVRLICFGTWNKDTNGLETFQITEQTRFWEPQIAREYLGLLYERQFKELIGLNWKEAFTTTEERKCAEKLLEVCTQEEPSQSAIRACVLELLEKIARSFGLRKKTGDEQLLRVYDLLSDHDIGIDPEDLESSFGGKNPFGGLTIRDSRNCLLGYIIYPLQNKADASRLRNYLGKHNRFHNVLVVYPDQKEAHLELWQGTKELTGKLRKGQDYKAAADVVNLLSRFFVVSKAKVKNPRDLAEELAFRARYLRRLALKQLKEEDDKGDLRKLYNAFKEALIHDQTEEEFADAFAQTITYGLLTARWIARDMLITSSQRFTRQTALVYLNSANPFLENMFENVLGAKHGRRMHLIWLVEDIAALLERVDVTKVFGAGDAESDPIIHFYEPFLKEYDNKLKDKRGVFFTPRPVVSYIVRSVHELLQTEFKLEDGLASTATWEDVQKNFPDLKLPKGVEPTDPFVCILDPATGTGTFLFECIEVIERTMKDRWCKELKKDSWKDRAIATRWNEYVAKHLLPRLYGYEIMMASYAIAHLKLSFKLAQTGYKLKETDHLNVYLTNSLEPPSSAIDPKLANLFTALAQQAQQVNEVKRDKKFTVIIGNPPYANFGQLNKIPFIIDLLEDYKRGLEEKKINLRDDFIKFIRFSQYLVDRMGIGIVGMITNNTFLDGSTRRRMRQHLLTTFESVLIVDLHGNSIERELSPDGSDDINVFDIQQGVSISFFYRDPKKLKGNMIKEDVRLFDLYGLRDIKYVWLNQKTVSTTPFTCIKIVPPLYRFQKRDSRDLSEYEHYFSISEMFVVRGSGVKTDRDDLCFDIDKSRLTARMKKAFSGDMDSSFIEEFRIVDSSSYDLTRRLKTILFEPSKIQPCLYRLFDKRWLYYHPGFTSRPAWEVMQHMVESNLGLIAKRQARDGEYNWFFVTRGLMVDGLFSIDNKGREQLFPLFRHDTQGKQGEMFKGATILNFSRKFSDELLKKIGDRKKTLLGLPDNLMPEDIFHYAYAIFYSPNYRTRYAEFLKIDFPRLPLTSSLELFRSLAQLGSELVALHLMESEKLNNLITQFVGDSSIEVEKLSYSNSTVWINKKNTTGFKGVSEDVWNFHIGGYQVCDKWLKDRKGRTLSQEDIEHYQKIIVALSETIRIMKEIDEVIDEHGGWPDAFAKGIGGEK